jgi:hypothetical protein
MRTRAALMTTTWMVGAGLAVTGVAVAMSVVGNRLLGPSTDLAQDLAPTPAVAAAPAHPGMPDDTARAFHGGTVYAACADSQVTLTHWSPDEGFTIADVASGPAADASVRFVKGSMAMLVTVTCPGNRLRFDTQVTSATAANAAAPGPAGAGSAATGEAGAGPAGTGTGAGGTPAGTRQPSPGASAPGGGGGGDQGGAGSGKGGAGKGTHGGDG